MCLSKQSSTQIRPKTINPTQIIHVGNSYYKAGWRFRPWFLLLFFSVFEQGIVVQYRIELYFTYLNNKINIALMLSQPEPLNFS